MAEPASERGPLETLSLAGIGALALAAGRADQLAEEIAGSLGVERDQVRGVLVDAFESWRTEMGRLAETTGEAAGRVTDELGVASSEAVSELELRVAQLEHRLKLLERSK